MKRHFIFCLDGTWQRGDQKYPSNVVHVYRSLSSLTKSGELQVPLYDEGVQGLLGGLFGVGLSTNIRQVERQLLSHGYNTERDRVSFVGFSRGAFTARSAAAFLGKYGLPQNEEDSDAAWRCYRRNVPAPPELDDRMPEVKIHGIFVFDTVGALGIPRTIWNILNFTVPKFHDTFLGPSVRFARHAVAMDERRVSFSPTLWSGSSGSGQDVRQVWFAGGHSDVGGGNEHRGLSDCSLVWMLGEMETSGIELEESALQIPQPDPDATMRRPRMLFNAKRRPPSGSIASASSMVRKGYVPDTVGGWLYFRKQ